MSGYLGTKAVLLSTTTATVGGDSTVGGDLTVDTNTLYVDSTNNRVGIGNAAPTQALDVTGDIVTSGGVYLGGTGSANLLDDYEEGTWTPSLAFGGGNSGMTYSQQSGTYRKVGSFVYVEGRIDLSNKGVSTGNATLGNFPFSTTGIGAGSVGFQRNIAPSGAAVLLTCDASEFIIRYVDLADTSQSNDTHFANNSILIFSGAYITT